MKNSLSHRLTRLLAEGNLTVADLARWFDRPHPTVRGWVLGGNLGVAAPQDAHYVLTELARLEALLRKKTGLPIPRMSARNRKGYLRELKEGR